MSKRKSRRKVAWRWPRNFRTSRKSKSWPEILAYEEQVVMTALIEIGRPITAHSLCSAFPGRFNGAKRVGAVLTRLYSQNRVISSHKFWRLAAYKLEHVYEFAPNYEPFLPIPRPAKETSDAQG
jgi:hypothetical protein